MPREVIVQHAVDTGKVVAGGAGTAVTTYQAVAHMDIAQATAYAGLTAAICTALYFAVSAAYTVWKWRKEANGKA